MSHMLQESLGICRASDTVYPILRSPNAEILTGESQTKPRCSSVLTSVCPRGDHISPPPAIMFLADSRLKHDRCEADPWNSLLWIRSHAKFIQKSIRDLQQDILAEIPKSLKKKRWNQHGNMSPSPSSIRAALNICFSEKQGQKCCLRFHLLIFALVFLSGVWEQMTNNTEGSTCRSLKVRERYDLSLWLTCAISLHTYSNSWLNPSFSHFSHHSAFAFSLFWSILQDKDLLFIRRSHLDPGRVATGWIWISYDDAFHWRQHEATVNIMSKKHRKISNK